MALPNITVCDDRFAVDYALQSQILFDRGQWTNGIAKVVQSYGQKYEAFVSGSENAQEYTFECEPMVYSSPGGTSVDIIGRHFGVRNCLSKAASTLYSFNKIEEISRIHGSALARAKDFIRISGIMQSSKFSDFTVVKKDYGPSTGLTPEKLIAAASIFGGNQVPTMDGMINVLASSGAIVGLFGSDKTTSSLFVPGQPLYNGRMYQFMGMTLRFGPEGAQNSIPSKDGTYTAIAVHRDALIETINMDMIQEVRPSLLGRIGWDFLSEFVSGLGVIDSRGVVLIEYDLANTPNK